MLDTEEGFLACTNKSLQCSPEGVMKELQDITPGFLFFHMVMHYQTNGSVL